MTQEWANRKNHEQESAIAEARAKCVELINSLPCATDQDKTNLMMWLEREEKSEYPCCCFGKYRILEYFDDVEGLEALFAKGYVFDKYDSALMSRNRYSRYVDSTPQHFDGDIVITDPCYVTLDDDWTKCDCGYEMKELGFTNYMTRDTLYGDWSCTTYNSDTTKPIGQFCADAGLVSVFLLDEVLAYNPDFAENYLAQARWTTTLIRNFKGEVSFVVKWQTGTYEEDGTYHKAGDVWEDYTCHVVGHGINKVTGELINFITYQTGL